jgi:hypothetical protein
MKDEIFNGLKQTYKGKYGVGDDKLQVLAEALDATGIVTKENLATIIKGQDSILKAFQSDSDRWNGERSNYEKQLDEFKKKQEEKPNPEDKGKGGNADEKPDVAKIIKESVAEAIKPYAEKIQSLEAGEKAKVRSSEIAKVAKAHNIPENVLKYMNIPEDANLEDFFKGAQQDLVNAGLESAKAPETGANGQDTEEDAIAQSITEGTKKIVEQQKK